MAARKSYNKAFKQEAIRLAEKSGVTQVASDLGLHPNMIYTWKRQLSGNADKAFPGNGNAIDPELSQLKKENARLKMEVEILKKAAYLSKSLRERYSVIRQLEGQYPVLVLSQVLQCSTSAYYSWRRGITKRREDHRRRLVTLVRTTYYESEKTYGSPRIYKAIKAMQVPCSRSHIVRIMKEEHIWAVHKRKFRVTTDSAHELPVAENLLARDFTATRPNEKWVSDITYIRTQEGWLYLAVIIDLFSRKVVGWSMRSDMKTNLLLEALSMAIRARRPQAGLIHHSDRGVQYASYLYQEALQKAGMLCSMSRKGNCWDNAGAESFFSTLKRELIYPNGIFNSREEARSKIFRYIETWYNRMRKHSVLQYLSPTEYEFEKQNLSLTKAA
ncbi:IS3 family transposase [Flavitalea flava]